VVGWLREAGFDLLCQEVRGQSMVIAGKLPPAGVGAGRTTHGAERR